MARGSVLGICCAVLAVGGSPLGALDVVKVAGPFSYPWAIAFLEGDRFLVTERTGALKVVSGAAVASVPGVPPVAVGGQGGLHDVLVVPGTGPDRQVILAYAHEQGGERSLRVSSAVLKGTGTNLRLEAVKPIFDMLPRTGTQHHYGGRLALLPDGTLLIATGERGDGMRAQNPSDGAGKIHRIRIDGTIPTDNPFLGKPEFLPSLWSWGHRNIQGMWVDATNGEVWVTEHGPQGGDEVNLARPGRNYGWPIITYGVNYGTGTKIGEGTAKAGFEQPVLYWKPSIAPSGLTRYDGPRYPGWTGSFFSGALAGEGVSRFRLGPPGTVATGVPARAQVPASGVPAALIEEDYLLAGVLGRIRDVRTGPDGWIYLVTDSPQGSLYRLVP